MTQVILIILAVVVVGAFVFWVAKKRAEKSGAGMAKEFVGICQIAVGIDAKKKENKEKILELLVLRGEISNSDIREALSVADRTVIRYMDELEREGKVEQVGITGRGVTYRLKP